MALDTANGKDQKDGKIGTSKDESDLVIDVDPRADPDVGKKPQRIDPLSIDDATVVSPLDTAPWYQKLWFNQVSPILSLGNKRQLQPEDMYPLERHMDAGMVYMNFVAGWAAELARWKAIPEGPKKPARPSLYRILLKMFGWDMFTQGVLQAIFAAGQVGGPNILKAIIIYISTPSDPLWYGLVLAFAYALVPFVGMLCQGHAFLTGFKVGMRIRALFTMSVYRKALRLSSAAKQDPALNQGKIINLMAIDAQAFVEGVALIHSVWTSPTIILIVIGLLYQQVGPSAFAGVGVMLCIFPVSMKIARKSMMLTLRQKRQTDQRVSVLSEILQGIRILKYNAWEGSFVDKVAALRAIEMRLLRRLAVLRAVNTFILFCTPLFTSLATFAVYTALGNRVTAQVVFPTIALFNVMRFPLSFLPMVINNVVKMNIARNRITDFLLAEEIEDKPEGADGKAALDPGCVIGVKDGNFHWLAEQKAEAQHQGGMHGAGAKAGPPGKAAQKQAKKERKKKDRKEMAGRLAAKDGLQRGFALKGINLQVRKGELLAVVGAVGCGKTSLISALIGEMERDGGVVNIDGRMAYAAQIPWICNGTLQDNILFGRDMDRPYYEQTLRACALVPDLKILRGGDMAEIGERGITLSGGQKQRVSIARTVYSQSDIVLLDDPLSAVDSHVGKHLFEKCIRGMMAGRTRVLVTNQLHVLPKCDRIIVVKDGVIVENGTYTELVDKQQGELKTLVQTYGQADHKAEEAAGGKDGHKEDDSGAIENTTVQKQDGKLTTTEERNMGMVDLHVYWKWFSNAGGLLFFVPLMFCLVSGQTWQILADVWMTVWTSNMSGRPTSVFAGHDVGFYLGMYVAIGFLAQLFVFCRALMFALGGVRASLHLHENLLKRVLRSRTSFFDETPVGRILNRFSKDTDAADQYLAQNMEQMFTCFIAVGGTLILTAVVFYWFLIVVPVIGFFYFRVQGFFRQSSRELQRIESTSRSPIYTQFSETLTGVSTIRCYGEQGRFTDLNKRLVNVNNRSFNILQISNRWLQVRLEFLGLAVMLTSALLAVCGRDSAWGGNPSLAGLILAYSLSIVQQMNWCVRMMSETETKMTSVERILEYSALDQEASAQSAPNQKPPPGWPSKGEVMFNGLCMRYRPELPQVLKNVKVTIQPGEKVGIVGRTGSGKSSLMVALFRLVEAEGGNVLIDGVDTSAIGLDDLRSNIAIIPQDPVLFSQKIGSTNSAFGKVGGIRFNLDPTGKHTDGELWEALDHAQMGAVVRALPNGLDAQVAENGENFSVGQRQLLCLARALLKKPRVLVLDEATANIDVDTDMLIQKTIRDQLRGVTCLTIAHRLHTIMDADKVMVMDKGVLAEFGHPSQLLETPNGIFASLVSETGPSSAAHLGRIARGEITIFGDEDLKKLHEEESLMGAGYEGKGKDVHVKQHPVIMEPEASSVIMNTDGSAVQLVIETGETSRSSEDDTETDDEDELTEEQKMRVADAVSLRSYNADATAFMRTESDDLEDTDSLVQQRR